MHAVNEITSGNLVAMIIGVIIFIVIYRLIFPPKKRK